MKMDERLNMVIKWLYGGNAKRAAMDLGYSYSYFTRLLREGMDLSVASYQRFSDKGINLQWLIVGEYTASAFNTSEAGALLAIKYPEFAPAGFTNSIIIDKAVVRLKQWIEQYVGTEEEFFEFGKFDAEALEYWRKVLAGALTLDAFRAYDLSFVGVNPLWLFARENEIVSPFSDSDCGVLLKLQVKCGRADTIKHPRKLTQLELISLSTFATRQSLQEQKI